jgi:hypothetical protein
VRKFPTLLIIDTLKEKVIVNLPSTEIESEKEFNTILEENIKK